MAEVKRRNNNNSNNSGGRDSTPKVNGKMATENASSSSASSSSSVAAAGKGRGGPDRDKFIAERDALDKQIESINASLKEIEGKMPQGDLNELIDARRKEMSAKQTAVLDELKRHRQRKTELIEKVKEQTNKRAQKQKELEALKTSMSFTNADKIDEKAAALEKKLASGTLTLLEEKQVVTELSTLKRSRKDVDSYRTKQQDLDNMKKTMDDLRVSIDNEEKEIQATAARLDALRAERTGASKSNKSSETGKYFALLDDRKALKKKLSEVYNQKKELYNNFHEQMEAYRKRMSEERSRRQEEQKRYRQQQEEEYKKRDAERKKAERLLPKFVAEINAATDLLSYLESLVPVETKAASSGEHNNPKPLTEEELSKEGLVLLTNKYDRDDDFFSGSARKETSRKKDPAAKKVAETPKKVAETPKKAAAPATTATTATTTTTTTTTTDTATTTAAAATVTATPTPKKKGKLQQKKITFDIKCLQDFMLLKVDVPVSHADIPATKEALQGKKTHFERRQKEELEKAQAEAKAEQEAEAAAKEKEVEEEAKKKKSASSPAKDGDVVVTPTASTAESALGEESASAETPDLENEIAQAEETASAVKAELDAITEATQNASLNDDAAAESPAPLEDGEIQS